MPNKKQTSPKVAAKAAKVLANPKSPAIVKSVAASALAQTKPAPKPKPAPPSPKKPSAPKPSSPGKPKR